MTMIPTHRGDQERLFPDPVAVTSGPLSLTTHIYLDRMRRQRCVICSNRRVCYAIVSGNERSVPMCARCAGIR